MRPTSAQFCEFRTRALGRRFCTFERNKFNKITTQKIRIHLPTNHPPTQQVYHNLKSIIKKKYGLDACNVGDEGGFAPGITSNEEGVLLVVEAIEKAGYVGKVKIAMDCAASEFYDGESKTYDLAFKSKVGCVGWLGGGWVVWVVWVGLVLKGAVFCALGSC